VKNVVPQQYSCGGGKQVVIVIISFVWRTKAVVVLMLSDVCFRDASVLIFIAFHFISQKTYKNSDTWTASRRRHRSTRSNSLSALIIIVLITQHDSKSAWLETRQWYFIGENNNKNNNNNNITTIYKAQYNVAIYTVTTRAPYNVRCSYSGNG